MVFSTLNLDETMNGSSFFQEFFCFFLIVCISYCKYPDTKKCEKPDN